MLEHRILTELEEYREQHLVRKDVLSGRQFKSIVLNLPPGQEVQPHKHAGHEVILVPRKGQATLIVDGTSRVSLRQDGVYSAGPDDLVQIRNDHTEDFQLLIILVRLSDTKGHGEVSH